MTRTPDTVEIHAGRPLIVCDADEVLLQFLAGLEQFLPSHGVFLDLASLALTGNIKRQSDGAPLAQADVSALIHLFHTTAGLQLQPVSGAAEALLKLSGRAQVVILSNVPSQVGAAREANLTAHGMAFPVIANSGLKGAAVAQMTARAGARTFFIDDIPHNHASVAEAAPDVHLVHFVADPRLARMMKPSPLARLFSSDWTETADHILAAMD